MSPILELRKATKEFRGVPAIKDIDFTLEPGEIHAIVGENGAGKSTLTKALAGVHKLTSGEMLFDGKPMILSAPSEALALGIAMVFQETMLVPSMTVAQNIYLGDEKLFNRLRGLYNQAQQFLAGMNFQVNPTALVSSLGAAHKQMVEIARAVHHKARIIIFDEPTASLTPEEKNHFFGLVRRLVKQGVAVIFISHALEEALMLADRITVLRDGELVATGAGPRIRSRAADPGDGRPQPQRHPAWRRPARAAALRPPGAERAEPVQRQHGAQHVVLGLCRADHRHLRPGRRRPHRNDESRRRRDQARSVLRRRREAGGQAGALSGAAASGARRHRLRDGRSQARRLLRDHVDRRQHPDRRRSDRRQPAQDRVDGEGPPLAKTWIDALSIRAIDGNARIIELSGGNQQKVVIAKSLVQKPKLIIFDEPTRGVDVGAIVEIHQLINRLADEGFAVVVISSYLPEIMALSDRILVARQGKIIEEMSIDEATEQKIMYAAVH